MRAVAERAPIDVHHELLVAALRVDLGPVALKDESVVVEAPVRLGVVAAERKLADVAEVHLALETERVGGRIVRIDERATVGAFDLAASAERESK